MESEETKAKHGEEPSGETRRRVLQQGVGLVAVTAASVALMSQGGEQEVDAARSRLSGRSLYQMIADLKQLYQQKKRNYTLVIDRHVWCEDDSRRPLDVTIPHYISVQVTGDGMIHLNGRMLVIEGPFVAPPRQVFSVSRGGGEPVFTARGANDKDAVLFRSGAGQPVLVPLVHAGWFGLVSDGVKATLQRPTRGTDNWHALQRAILSAREVRRLVIPQGSFLIKDTLHIKDHYFRGFRLEGQGNLGSAPVLLLDSRASDRPLLNIEYARGTTIRSLRLIGVNFGPGRQAISRFSPRPGDWIVKGRGGGRLTSGRNNPYCAIATDAFGGHVRTGRAPRTAYAIDPSRGRTYNLRPYTRYPNGLQNASGSAEVTIEEVAIEGFVSGVAISPGGALQNDTIRVKRCHITNCTYGISVGTSQARACHFAENNIIGCYAAIENTNFGHAIGSLFTCTTNQYTRCRMLYHVNAASGGPGSITGDYAENFIRVGSFGNVGHNVSGATISFHGCYFNHGIKRTGLHLISSQNAMLQFTGCTFIVGTRSPRMLLVPVGLSAQFVFQSCHFRSRSGTVFPDIQVGSVSPGGVARARSRVHFHQCRLRLGGRIRIRRFPPIVSFSQRGGLVQSRRAQRLRLHWGTQALRGRDPADGFRDSLLWVESNAGTRSGLPEATFSKMRRAGQYKLAGRPNVPDNFMRPESGAFDPKQDLFMIPVLLAEDTPYKVPIWLPIGKLTTYARGQSEVTIEVDPSLRWEVERVSWKTKRRRRTRNRRKRRRRRRQRTVRLPLIPNGVSKEPAKLQQFALWRQQIKGVVRGRQVLLQDRKERAFLKPGDFLGTQHPSFRKETRIKKVTSRGIVLTRPAKGGGLVTLPMLYTLKKL